MLAAEPSIVDILLFIVMPISAKPLVLQFAGTVEAGPAPPGAGADRSVGAGHDRRGQM
jgi:hypothetical protein